MGMWQQLDRAKLKWELVTDETVRGMLTTHGDAYYNREHNVFWINVSGNKTSMVTSKSVTLDVPPPANDEWANQVVADLEEYYQNGDKSNDDDGVIRLVPLPERKTTLRKTADEWEIK